MSYFLYNTKKVFYRQVGRGKPVVFLHGNAASSGMFELLLPLYQEHFTVILVDFLGHGQSDRLEQFPADLWFDEGLQTAALLEHLGCPKADLVGTSGGAIAALNAALERPDLIGRVVADSFEGRTLYPDFSKNLLTERALARGDANARLFYEWCHGEDWARIVDQDTQTLVRFARSGLPLFRKPLDTLQNPLLLMGSREDDMIPDPLEEYLQIKKLVRRCSVHVFETGGHPAIASNAEEAARIITEFLNR